MGSNRSNAGFTPGRWVTWEFQGDMDTAIAIRTAVLRTANCTFQAGAGIVADSDPESRVARDLQQGPRRPAGGGTSLNKASTPGSTDSGFVPDTVEEDAPCS